MLQAEARQVALAGQLFAASDLSTQIEICQLTIRDHLNAVARDLMLDKQHVTFLQVKA